MCGVCECVWGDWPGPGWYRVGTRGSGAADSKSEKVYHFLIISGKVSLCSASGVQRGGAPALGPRSEKKWGVIGCHMQFSTEDLGQLPLIQDPATLKNRSEEFVHTTITCSPNLRIRPSSWQGWAQTPFWSKKGGAGSKLLSELIYCRRPEQC